MIKPIKELGQNFLRNKEAISKIVNLIEINDFENIIEIGPGEGVITYEILKVDKNFNLTSIDVDERVAEEMTKIQDKRFKFVLGNILKQDEVFNQENYKIVGAIPYNITSPIIHKIIEQKNLPKIVVLVVQKEVGEKICDKEKGSYMSNFIKLFFDINYEFKIPKKDFYPEPKVDSAVIKFTKKESQTEIDKNKFSSFLHKTFRSPRKKINKVFSKELLEELNINSNNRPEDLTIDEILKLYNREN